MFKKYSFVILPVIASLLSALLFVSSLDGKIFDSFLNVIPSLTENKSVLLVNVDDQSIDYAGIFPWTRDLYADALIFMREMGAETAVFDLSFLDNSTPRVDPAYINNQLPRYLDEGFAEINENIDATIDDIAEKGIDASKAETYKADLHRENNRIQNQLDVNIAYVTRDVDAYLADTFKFFGDSYLTLTMVTKEDISGAKKTYGMDADILAWLQENIAIKEISVKNDTKTPEQIGIWPAIHKLLVKAAGAGFVNAPVDPDGYRRRVYLLLKHEGLYYSHLILSALRKRLGNPDIEISNSAIILKNASVEGRIRDIRIPRAQDGSVLIKWPKKVFRDYNTMSILNFIMYPRLERVLAENLSLMSGNNFFSNYWDEEYTPLEHYQNAEYIKEILYDGEDNEDGVTFETYLEYRQYYLDAVDKFLNGGYEERILAGFPGDAEAEVFISGLFGTTRKQFNELMSIRAETVVRTKGSLCIIGVDATSMTDVGITAFQERFPNVGIYAAAGNMILSGEFLDDAPWYVSFIAAIILSIILAFIIKKLDIGKSIFAGLSAMLITVGLFLMYFTLTMHYVGLVVPFASVTLTFLSLTALNFLTTLREKSFLRSAFSRYLAPDVIKQIIADPSRLELGGENREMTAIFTDIQSFSSISELLTAPELVELLNLYLTEMSNIVLENRGTVDKYEGDAIIAFFGAPTHMEEHASLACRTAIQMKKTEFALKEKIMTPGGNFFEPLDRLIKAGKIRNESPLYTRIGVNTGDMVVGNMGTPNKMDYTIMGNAVNLAARLEGVNKQYNTGGILISEYTRNKIGNEFIVRPLDRVRVVGINTPVRLYELLEISANADTEMYDMLKVWEQALRLYEEEKDFSGAGRLFQSLFAQNQNDQVAKLYLSRCNEYIRNPPSAGWDAVNNLTQK
ncbi:MAG: CHASE2 domain-containing protein [Treponema sp.]|jgi:adenylate cyclase|nr:CHASE2 domain-containing protein [Treponema sp.]